ncbi:MAG: hypothetical protein ACJA0N_002411 [Pseudohongiellaceae bacterium]|jgi:hypothetical protein
MVDTLKKKNGDYYIAGVSSNGEYFPGNQITLNEFIAM